VAKVVEAIQLKNTDADSQFGIRTATITYTDINGSESESVTASLSVAFQRGPKEPLSSLMVSLLIRKPPMPAAIADKSMVVPSCLPKTTYALPSLFD
jgi:hypothetical protein